MHVGSGIATRLCRPPSVRRVDSLCHNLTCLTQEQETWGITPIFWKDEQLSADEKPAILPMVAQ